MRRLKPVELQPNRIHQIQMCSLKEEEQPRAVILVRSISKTIAIQTEPRVIRVREPALKAGHIRGQATVLRR